MMNWSLNKTETLSLFSTTQDFWSVCNEPMNQLQLIHQGKVYQKNPKNRKWESCHLELYFDRLIKVIDNQRELCNINGCYLKKIKYSDASFQPYKYGFRLHYNKQRCEFFTENVESDEKWQNALKRYTILTKFYKKYKLICKQKLQEYFPAQTYKAQRVNDSLYFQIRIIDKSQLEDKISLINEIQFLRRLDHLYIQKIQEVYEDAQFIYIVYDQYAGREQRYLLAQLHSAQEKVIAECIYKLLQGLNHIHNKGLFHRDIKFDNIFNRFPDCITDVCIVNFGSGDIIANKFHKRIGTPGFMAPEIFKTKQYDQTIDVYSLGIVFYYIVFGQMPYGIEFHEILKKNEIGEIEYPNYCRISNSGLELMKLMLMKDPTKRFTSFQALNHHWFINLKIRELLGKPGALKTTSGVNLSTILEKSEMIDQSMVSYQHRSIEFCEPEFQFESLFEKMQNLPSLIKFASHQKDQSTN